MQHFQSILIIIGIVAIAGVLIHGYLLSRKEQREQMEDERENALQLDMFFENESATNEPANSPEQHYVADSNNAPLDKTQDNSPALETASEEISPSQPITQEVVFTQENYQPEELAPVAPNTKLAVQPEDLFIFNVVAREGALLGGHELLQFFLTSGFRFGDMSIFHRHQNADGTGPVLFSIANMMAPGVFEPEYMEQFKSQGVSFFLTAPNDAINIKSSFDLMLRAVEQMADEFNCVVLNAEREKMTKEQFIEYNNRLLHYI